MIVVNGIKESTLQFEVNQNTLIESVRLTLEEVGQINSQAPATMLVGLSVE